MPVRRRALRGSGTLDTSPRLYGWSGRVTTPATSPSSMMSPGVHHGDPVDDGGDRRQVVGHVHERDAELALQAPHLREDRRLRDHVEAGRRLVEHDHGRLAGDREGEREALLLASGELVGVAPQERPRRSAARRAGRRRGCARWLLRSGACASRISRTWLTTRIDGLSDVGGSCGHVRDHAPAQRAELALAATEQLAPLHAHAARRQMQARDARSRAAPGRAVGLAAARLADEADRLPGMQVERDRR